MEELAQTPYYSLDLTDVSIWGDSIIGRALQLLLLDSNYNVRFLPVSSLNLSEALRGVQVLLLTPTPQLSTEHRKALLASIKEIQEAEEFIVLELVSPSEERREEETRDEQWPKVPWPCRIVELEQRIEAALGTKVK